MPRPPPVRRPRSRPKPPRPLPVERDAVAALPPVIQLIQHVYIGSNPPPPAIHLWCALRRWLALRLAPPSGATAPVPVCLQTPELSVPRTPARGDLNLRHRVFRYRPTHCCLRALCLPLPPTSSRWPSPPRWNPLIPCCPCLHPLFYLRTVRAPRWLHPNAPPPRRLRTPMRPTPHHLAHASAHPQDPRAGAVSQPCSVIHRAERSRTSH